MSGETVAPVTGVEFRREWSDPDVSDGDWPPPDHGTEHVATGELAERVRARLGVADPDAEVLLVHTEQVGGYSEFTAEYYYWFTVRCAGREKEFDQSSGSTGVENGLVQLLAWLDGTPEPPKRQPTALEARVIRRLTEERFVADTILRPGGSPDSGGVVVYEELP